MTNEGAAAVEELISFLKNEEPIDALSWNDNLQKAALDHV